MRRISVSKSPTFTGQVREVFHQATPAQGQRLATHLIQRLPACPIPEIARLGANPTQMEGRTRRLLRHRRSQQRTPQKPSTDIIELGKRTARGYRNPTNYQLRMLLIAGSLDASTHNSTLKSRVRPQFLMWSCFHDGLCCDESPQDWLSSLSLGKGRPLSVA